MSYNSKYKSSEIEAILDSVEGKQDEITDLATIRSGAAKGATALQSYTEKYTGTITGIKMNGASKGTNGVVDLGTVITAHQDISGKQDKLVSGTNIKTINGTPILGSGNITISGGGGGSSSGSGAYPEVNHGTSDTTFTLTPNTFHVWEEVSALTLTLGSETAGVANEFLFQFTSGATATTLTLPDDIKWANDTTPTIVENMIYQVSILKGMASVLEFSNKSKTKQCKLNRGYDIIVLEFEDGMTWNDWVNSSYNVYSLYVSGTRVHINPMFIVSGVTPSDVMEEKDYTSLMWD